MLAQLLADALAQPVPAVSNELAVLEVAVLFLLVSVVGGATALTVKLVQTALQAAIARLTAQYQQGTAQLQAKLADGIENVAKDNRVQLAAISTRLQDTHASLQTLSATVASLPSAPVPQPLQPTDTPSTANDDPEKRAIILPKG